MRKSRRLCKPAAKHPLSDTALQHSDFHQPSGLARDGGGTRTKQHALTTAFGQRAAKGETACEHRAGTNACRSLLAQPYSPTPFRVHQPEPPDANFLYRLSRRGKQDAALVINKGLSFFVCLAPCPCHFTLYLQCKALGSCSPENPRARTRYSLFSTTGDTLRERGHFLSVCC